MVYYGFDHRREGKSIDVYHLKCIVSDNNSRGGESIDIYFRRQQIVEDVYR